jgi:hypothetical protein
MTKTDKMHSREVKVAVSLWRGTLLFKKTAEVSSTPCDGKKLYEDMRRYETVL